MARGGTSDVLRDVRTLYNLGTLAGLSDRDLLERFAGRSDDAAQAAFAGLMARHGPMVLGVCRRALDDPNDVNDAFQATFLVLVRKAESVRVADSLGRWLHGVSRRVSARARSAASVRAAREAGDVEWAAAPCPDPARDELGAILDEEIGRLPGRFRAAVILCDLEGLSYDAAAEHLGCAVGTLKSRLSRAREKLRSRLSRRGLAPSAIAAGARPVPGTLAAAAACPAGPTGEVPAAVEGLAREVLRTMFVSKLKMAAAAALAVASLTATGVGVSAWQEAGPTAPRERQAEPAAKGSRPEKEKDADEPAPPRASGRVVLRPFVDRAWYAIFSPDGKSLVAGTNTSGGIRAYELATRKKVGLLDGEPKTKYACAAFSPDGKILATSGGSRVLIWDFAGRRLLTSFEAHPGGTRSLAFSPDGETLASGGDDRAVKLWGAGTWARRPTIPADESVYVVAFSPDGKTLAVATGGDSEARTPRVKLYDYDESGAVKERIGLDAGRRGPVWTLAFSPDGRTLASAGFDPMVKVWDPSTGRELATLKPEGGITTGGNWARGLAFTPDGKTLAAGQSDGTITLWDVTSGRQTLALPGHEQHLFTVSVSPDGKVLAGASKDGSVGLWDLGEVRPE